MSAAPTVRLVAGRELRERGRSKAFWITTAVLLLGIVAAIVIPATLGHHGVRTFQVGTVGAPGGLASSVTADAAALGGRAHVRAIGSVTQARSALYAQTLDLVIEGETAVLVRGQNTDQSVAGLAHLVARDLAVQARLRAAGLPAAAVEHAGPGRVRVTFSDADPQAVLDRARAAGTVRRFALEEPSLSELFLQAVGP